MSSLTKAQAQRLRFYFSRGSNASAHLDGTDLDLVGHKYIEISKAEYGRERVSLLPLGLGVLHQHRQADIQNRSGHHSLGERLAHHLRSEGRITWEDIEFKNLVADKESKTPGGDCYAYWRVVRPDVFSIAPSLNIKTANPCVHEVKVSRADFLSDLAKPQKREAYALLAQAVYYVAPEGIIQTSEVPQGMGLMVERKQGEFVLLKRPKKNKVELHPHHFLNLIIKRGVYPENHGIGM